MTSRTSGTSGPVVLKVSGELLEDQQRARAVGGFIASLHGQISLVVVHGGGRDIDAALARAGIAKRQVDGLRITDDSTLDVVVSVLAGLLNTRLVAAVTTAGADAVGLTGADASLGLVDKAPRHRSTDGRQVDLGRVGIPRGSKRQLLLDLCRQGYVPVIASIGMARSGDLYNVNADTFAAHMAASLGAHRLVIAGGTAGVLDDGGALLPALDLAAIDRLVASGTATAGMVAKLSACRDALSGGVDEVLIADGRDLPALAEVVRQGAGTNPTGCTWITRHLMRASL